MDNLCIRSFLQETQSLSLLILIWCVASVPTVSPYPFFSISFLSCNIYLYYELNDFLFCLICFSLVFFWCHYNSTVQCICQHIFVFFLQLLFILLFAVYLYYVFFVLYIIFWHFHSAPSFPSRPHTGHPSFPILINRQDAIHTETANTHEYCVMWYMLSFCHQARCLSVSEFERLADHKRMYHIADAMVFAGLCGWRPVVFIAIYIYPLL